jgi:hypothetical protein
MKLLRQTYLVDPTSINDLEIDIDVEINGIATKFTSAYLFVQWVFGYDNSKSHYEFLLSEDLRHKPHYATVHCSIGWYESNSDGVVIGESLGWADFRTGFNQSNADDLKASWQKAWNDAVKYAAMKVRLGYLKGAKLVEGGK